MKRLSYFCFLFFISLNSIFAINLDSLANLINQEENVSKKIKYCINLSNEYLTINLNKSDSILQEALLLAKANQKVTSIIRVNIQLGTVQLRKGDYITALDYYKSSLKDAEKINQDTLKATCYLNIASCMDYLSKLDSCKYYNELAIESANILKDTLLMAQANNNLGIAYYYMGVYDSSIRYYDVALKIYEELNHTGRIDVMFNNASNYYAKGNLKQALKIYLESAEGYEELGNQYNKGLCLHNAGQLYVTIDLLDDAETVLKEALDIFEKVDSKIYIAQSKMLIASVYETTERSDEALALYLESYKAFNMLQDIPSLASITRAIGVLYTNKENYKEAEKYLKQSQEFGLESNNEPELLKTYLEYGKVFFYLKNYNKALAYYEKSESLILKTKENRKLQEIYNAKYGAHKELGNYEKALFYHEMYAQQKDSLINQEKIKELAQLEETFKSKQKQSQIEQLEIDKNLQHEIIENQKAKQKLLYASLVLGCIVIVLIAFGLYSKNKTNKIIKKQKELVEETNEELNQTNEEIAAQRDEIESQKNAVEEAHQEIKDSIIYAKRIQNAILPAPSVINENIPESFILYKPKDVVAGDFYWLEPGKNTVLFAVADCTGHGVPGAMVSVVCHNAMNRAVREFGLTEPGLILDKTCEIVVAEFEKSEDDVKDGMDIALCSLSGNTLQYAGAHNPLWIIRNNEILETKADKQPIGKFENKTLFFTHNIELQKGDSIYIFSDGFADQFGGEKDKKFGSKRMKELLISIQDKTMSEQNEILNLTLTNWVNQGKDIQIDDVCVMGLKI